jgi:hypothetical protein
MSIKQTEQDPESAASSRGRPKSAAQDKGGATVETKEAAIYSAPTAEPPQRQRPTKELKSDKTVEMKTAKNRKSK